MRGSMAIATVLAAALIPSPQAWAGLWSKTYNFKTGVTLEVGAETDSGLRLDSVRFEMPQNAEMRTAREATVEVTISNSSESAQRIGLALALFDANGRLVGVADGGTSLVPLRSGRLKIYRLGFKNVNTEAPQAATFQISVETNP